MTDVLDFLPVFAETLTRVRARMDADANAGLDPTDPAWIDTRQGTFYWAVTQVCALEIARLWDALASETVAAAFPSSAWGDYLDEHAATFGLERNPAVPATGEVMFNGDAGVLVAVGTQVSAPPSDPSFDAIGFVTTDSGTTSAPLVSPGGVTLTPSATGGSLPAGTYHYRVTAYNEFGETTASADQQATATGGASTVRVAWSAVTGALGYRVYRATALGSPGQLLADLNTLTFTDHGDVAPGGLEPTENTTSGVILPVVATQDGSIGNLGAGAIDQLETILPGIRAVTNLVPTGNGEDTEDDPALRDRILAQYEGQGGGNQNDYVKWSLAFVGVERAKVVPVWSGPGTVLVIPMLSDGSPVSTDTATSLQALLDPTPGQGAGQAPIGAAVTVETTVALNLDIDAVLQFAPGYSLDGTSGTIATRPELDVAIGDYIASLNPGDTLAYQALQAQFFVEGVRQVTSLTVNGATADVTLNVSPPQYPVLNLTMS